MAFIDVNGVSKSFVSGSETRQVLSEASLSVDRGEFVSIVGMMGCGKSTFLKILAGLISADAGRVEINGSLVRGVQANAAIVFQNYSLLPWFSALENVRLAVGAAFPDWPKARHLEQATRHLGAVGLGNALQKRPMACYGDAATIADVRQVFGYVFDPATPRGGGLPQLELFTITGPFCIGGQEIVPVPVFHGTREVLGYRFGSFAYLTDCSRIPDASWPLLADLDVLVLDALRERPHPTHFSLAEAIDAAQRIAARQVYFTHMC